MVARTPAVDSQGSKHQLSDPESPALCCEHDLASANLQQESIREARYRELSLLRYSGNGKLVVYSAFQAIVLELIR